MKIGFYVTQARHGQGYDRVEWDYLENSLMALDFPTQFTHLVMQCVRTASFSILLNGASKGLIVPSRSLY